MDNIEIKDIYRYCQDMTEEEILLIGKAYDFAFKCHDGQKRQSGEPYIKHPLNVAFTLASLYQGTSAIIAGLLHDVVEDTDTTIEEIEEKFGKDVATLVDGVTKIQGNPLDTLRKLLISGLFVDPRIIMIKLADRLHNMRTLEFKSEEKQKEKAKETMLYYVPTAYYTGVYEIKMELEDLAFMYLEPEKYKKICEKKIWFEIENVNYIESVLKNVKDQLKEHGVDAEVVLKTKNIYRIYKALEARDTENLEEIPSMVSLKIIVKDKIECYRVLGIINNIYKPLNSVVKDFISTPRENGYQSIHTTFIGPYNMMVQAHIRTEEMDKVADYGIFSNIEKDIKEMAAHNAISLKLAELNEIYKNSEDFLTSVVNEIFIEDTIYPTTPRGDLVPLPSGASVIDFAYAIHTDIGNKMIGAKVNKKNVGIDYVLKHNDNVNILIDESASPDERWLEYAKTSKAKEEIKKCLKNKTKKINMQLR